MAVRVIEATAYAVQLLAFVPKMLLAWMAGYSDWAEIFLAVRLPGWGNTLIIWLMFVFAYGRSDQACLGILKQACTA